MDSDWRVFRGADGDVCGYGCVVDRGDGQADGGRVGGQGAIADLVGAFKSSLLIEPGPSGKKGLRGNLERIKQGNIEG